VTDKLTLKYFFTVEPGVTPQMLTLTTNFNQCQAPTGITQFAPNVFAVNLSCVGTLIYPGGQSQHRREIQFRVTGGSHWDATNDPSFAGLSTTAAVKTKAITLYDGGTLIWGTEPTGTTTPPPTSPTSPPPGDTTPPSVPGKPAVSNVSTSTATLTWAASTDSGSGVAGYDVYKLTGTTSVLVGSTATTTYALTGLTPMTTYSYSVVARDVAGNASAASPAASFTTFDATISPTPSTPPPAGGCKVTYSTSDWNTGFTGSIHLTNTGTTPLTWQLAFAFTAGQKVTQGWSATWSQSGANVTATGLDWNKTLAAGASTDIGFNGTHTGTDPKPTSFTVNGQACTIG
jgi:endoglucanase